MQKPPQLFTKFTQAVLWHCQAFKNLFWASDQGCCKAENNNTHLWTLPSPFIGYCSLTCSSRAPSTVQQACTCMFISRQSMNTPSCWQWDQAALIRSICCRHEGRDALGSGMAQNLEARYDACDSKLKDLFRDTNLQACDQMNRLPYEPIQLHQVHCRVHRVGCSFVLQGCHNVIQSSSAGHRDFSDKDKQCDSLTAITEVVILLHECWVACRSICSIAIHVTRLVQPRQSHDRNCDVNQDVLISVCRLSQQPICIWEGHCQAAVWAQFQASSLP